MERVKMRNLFLVFGLFFGVVGYSQTMDASKSQVKFEIGNMKVRTVRGTFTGMKGTIRFSEKDLASARFDVCVDAASINTNDTKRDNHLRSADFFDVAKYPTICFTSSAITKTPTGYLAKGMLTLHGVTREVLLPFSFSNTTFVGTLSVNRYDYNVGADTGTFLVGNAVKLTIQCTLK